MGLHQFFMGLGELLKILPNLDLCVRFEFSSVSDMCRHGSISSIIMYLYVEILLCTEDFIMQTRQQFENKQLDDLPNEITVKREWDHSFLALKLWQILSHS